jgi:glycerol-3-phosphate O-acyltransferase
MGVDTTYKLVLREHLGYLVDTRFNVEWYIEGGRSLAGAFEQRDHSA